MTHSHPHHNLKFRPVLTLSQIQNICALAQDNGSPESHSILKALIPIIAKIEVGAISPAYKLSEIAQAKQIERSERERYENDLMTSEESEAYESKILGIG